MQLSEATLKFLNGWIGPGTWHTNHQLDDQRFFRFINQLCKDEGFNGSIEELFDFIKAHQEEKGQPLNKALSNILMAKLQKTDFTIEYQRYINSLG